MESSLSFRFADLDDINTIGFLAQQIWPVTYGDILPSVQLDYMLNLFYSPASLRKQMTEDKHRFLIVEEDEEAIGFASWAPAEQPGVFKLHKLYVQTGRQGKGRGKAILHFIFDDVRARGGTTLRLNVNRWNKARQFYERMGFSVVREEDVAIGNNYFMNDYVMEMPVPV
jgi:GNAT superfamily N-acetyltransferase